MTPLRRVAFAMGAGLALVSPAVAQSGHFPWRAGDKPPKLVGFWLGQRLDSARKALKGPVKTDTLGRAPTMVFSYSTADNSLSVLGTSAGGVAIITVPPLNIDTNFTAEEIRRVYQDASAAVRIHAGAFKELSASVVTKPEFYLKLVRLILQNRVRIVLR